MSEFPSTFDKFRQMPRALRWSILALLAIGLYLLWDISIAPLSQQWNKEAELIQSRVREVRASDRVVRQLRSRDTQWLVTAIGPVRIPVSVAEGSKMFRDEVNDVLQKHGASNHNFSSRSRGKLGKTALIEVTGGEQRIDRLTGDVKFDATPKAAAAIIAELESSPHIESVNSVRLIRDAGGRVKVSLTIEAWLLSSESGKSGAVTGESI